MPTPFANALLRLWNKFALYRGFDANNPPATKEEAYRPVIALQLQEMRDVAGDIYRDANAQQAGAVCATCGAGPLDHFYTSWRDGRILCASCFRHRVGRGIAREADTYHP